MRARLVQTPFDTPPRFVRETEHGTLEMWIDRPGWLLSRARGRFDLGHCSVMLRAGDEALQMASSIRFVHDWREVTAFDPMVPVYLAGWAARHARSVEHSTIVTRSPLVTMTARAANVTLKNLLLIATDDTWLERAFTTW